MASSSPSARKAFLLVFLYDFCQNPAYDSCAIQDLVLGYKSVCKKFGLRPTAQNFITTIVDLSHIALPLFDVDSTIDNNLHDKKGPLSRVEGSFIIFPRCREVFRLIQDQHRRNNHPFTLTLNESKQTLCNIGRSLEDAVNGKERFKRMNAHQVALELVKQRGKVRDLLSRPYNRTPERMDIDSAEDEELPYENEDAVHFDTSARANAVAGPSRLRGDEDAGDGDTQDSAASCSSNLNTPRHEHSRAASFYRTPESMSRTRSSGIDPRRSAPPSPTPASRTSSIGRQTPGPSSGLQSELTKKNHEIVGLRQENGQLREWNNELQGRHDELQERHSELQEEKSVAQRWYQVLLGNVAAQAPSFFTS